MRQRILGSHTPPCHRRMVVSRKGKRGYATHSSLTFSSKNSSHPPTPAHAHVTLSELPERIL